MYASIHYQPFQRYPSHVPAYRVKAGKYDCLGSIIYYQFNSGSCFQSLYISALPADYTAFHLVVGQRHYRNGALGHMVGRAALYGQRNYIAGLSFSLLLGFGFHIPNKHGRVAAGFVFYCRNQLLLGLIRRQSGDTLQFVQPALLQFLSGSQLLLQFLFPLHARVLARIQGKKLFFQLLLALVESFLAFLNLSSSFLAFSIAFIPQPVHLFLSLVYTLL